MSAPAAGFDGRWVGAAVPRKEDRRMLLGRGRFTGDLIRPGMLHAAFVRSPHAHALVGTIDGTAARQVPGVAGLFTAAGLGHPYLLAMLERDEFVPTSMPILAGDRARFVGEPVAMVVAEDAYLAEDAAELVEVDWDPLPVAANMEAATAATAAGVEEHEGAPRLHDHGNCLVDLLMFDDDRLPQIFAAAKTCVSATFRSARVAALPLEGRACLAEWDDRDDQLVVHVSTQVPHQVRSGIAHALDIPERAIRVIAPDVGGGFGLKCVVGREEVAVAAAALRLRRPVRWAEDRQENLIAAFHGHEQRYQVKAAFDEQGRILGLDTEIDCDTGAYSVFPFTCAVEPLMAATELPGVYKVPAYRARGRAIATQQGPSRTVPGRLSAADRAGHGAADGKGRGRAPPRPAAGAADQPDRPGGVPLHRRQPDHLRRGQLPRVPRPGGKAGERAGLAGRARPAPASGAGGRASATPASPSAPPTAPRSCPSGGCG